MVLKTPSTVLNSTPKTVPKKKVTKKVTKPKDNNEIKGVNKNSSLSESMQLVYVKKSRNEKKLVSSGLMKTKPGSTQPAA